MANTPNNQVILSTVQPDYSLILSQFDTVLPQQETWQDIYYGATGQAVLRYIASIGYLDQFGIEHAYRESFRQARLDSSIMGQAQLLGVRSPRKTPCSITVNLTNTSGGNLTIPAYSQMTVGGTLVFNRNALTFTAATPTLTGVTLYEGTLSTFTLRSDGTQYQQFVSQDSNYTVSDSDVTVAVNNIEVSVEQRPLWLYADVNAVEDTTTPTGQLQLMFGDGTFGIQPGAGDTVSIGYAVTQGAAGVNSSLSGQAVTVAGISFVTGVATSGLAGGTDQRNTTYFRQLSPQLFAAHDTATTKNEMSAVAASYAGAIDAQVIGQRQLAPSDNRYMNLVAVSILANPPFTAFQWDQFVSWFATRSTYPVRPFRMDPKPLNTAIVADVYCQGTAADLTVVESEINTAIQTLFALRTGIINTNIFLSDIISTILGADASIEYTNLQQPTQPIVSQVEPPVLSFTADIGGGTLPAGQYSYGVTVVTPQGESLAQNFASVSLSATGGVTINWTPNQSTAVLGFNVYGRTPVGMGLIASLPATAFSYTDTGAVTPTQKPPAINQTGFYYPALTTVTLNLYYTSRLLMSNINPTNTSS